jgi:hypothetical protein
MTTRADGMRRIATANATIATVSVAGVVGLSVMLAQQGTHHATIPTTVTSTTQTSPASSSAATTVTATPQATVQQSTSGSVQHAVTSGS